MAVEPGKYLATVEDFGIGTSSKKGTPLLNVKFKLKETGNNVYWTQYLTANTMERVVQNLVETGLLATKRFSDLAEGVDGKGIATSVEVELVVINEEYEITEGKDKGQKRVAAKVEYVNKPGGLAMKGMLAKAEAITALAGLNLDAEILAAEQKTGVDVTAKDVTGDSVPF